MNKDIPRWLDTGAGWAWRLIVLSLAVVGVFFATTKVQLLFVAVFLALVFTAVLRPMVEWLSKRLARWLAVALSMLTGFAFFGGMLSFVIFSVAGQWDRLKEQFVQGVDELVNLLHSVPLPIDLGDAGLQQWLDAAQEWARGHGNQLADQAVESAAFIAEGVATLILALFLSMFFLHQGSRMWRWFLDLLPERMHGHWIDAAGAGWYTFSGYTRGAVIVAASDGLLAGLALWALGVPLAAPLGVLVFIGAFIPLVGAPAAMIVAMLVALAANGPINAILVGIIIALIGQFEGHVLQPFVMGKQVSLHPAVVAVVVVGGTLLGGILGAIVAVPLTAVAWAVFVTLRAKDSQEPETLEAEEA